MRDLGVDEPGEIDVEAIAHYCGATVLYEPMRGSQARLLARGDRAIITVNRSSHPTRRRFSAAHELGHWMLDRRRNAFDCTSRMLNGAWDDERPENDPEMLANRWAADLLMPSSLFLKEAEGRAVTFETVRDLARRFRTSLTATALQLVRRGPLPAMLICSRRDRRWKWFVRGPGVPRKLWPTNQPGRGTVAWNLLNGCPNGRRGPCLVAADGWVKRSDAWWYALGEDAVMLGNGEVLSLVWWKDDQQLRALAKEQWLPHEPYRATKSLLLKTLLERWGYERKRQVGGTTVLEVEGMEVEIPHFRELDRSTVYDILKRVAWQKLVWEEDVVNSMLEVKYQGKG